MRLVCDEGVDRQIVERLRAGEHEVVYIAEVAQGATDEEVLRRAAQEKALLLTTDKDFGELVFRQQRSPHGVVLLRLAGLSQERKAAAVATALARYGHELENGLHRHSAGDREDPALAPRRLNVGAGHRLAWRVPLPRLRRLALRDARSLKLAGVSNRGDVI